MGVGPLAAVSSLGALSIATRRQRESIFRQIEKTHGARGSWPGSAATSSLDATGEPSIRTPRATLYRRYAASSAGPRLAAAGSGEEAALEARLTRVDPTAGVRLVRPKTEGFAVWTDDDVAAFRRRWPLGTRERLASRFCVRQVFAAAMRSRSAGRICGTA